MQCSPARSSRRLTVLFVGLALSLVLSTPFHPTARLLAQDDIAAETDSFPLWGDLRAGPYAVGFRVDWLIDPSRTGPGSGEDTGRLLRVFTWYPAVAGTGRPSTMGDYLAPEEPDERWATLAAYLDQRDSSTFLRQLSPTNEPAIEILRKTPVPARRDAEVAEGRFPLVLHSLGRNDYQMESTVLWEYLASHGYVVAVAPQLGIDGDRPTLAFEPADMAAQAADLALVLGEFAANPGVDATSVAVIGHSSGGIAALLLARHEPRVTAIIGLEASFGTADGHELLDALDYPYREQDLSVLDLYARASRTRDETVIEALTRSDRFSIALGGEQPPKVATHFDFQNWPLYSVRAGVEDDRGAGARAASWASEVYRSAIRLTRSFLDHHVMEDTGTAWDPELGTLPLERTDVHLEHRPAAR